MERFVDQDLTGAEFRECLMSNTRFVGVVLQDADIDGLVTNLVVNGVEVMAYVEAELDRRHPVRLLIRSEEPADLLEAHRRLRADWAATVERMRATPGIEQESVHDEWSAVQTMRHLVFVHDSWFRRCCLGSTDLFTPMGIGTSEEPYREAHGLDLSPSRASRRSWAVRERQLAELGGWLEKVTSEQLGAVAPVPDDDVWPPYARGRSVRQCLGTVLNETFEHHGFCVRDLELVSTPLEPTTKIGSSNEGDALARVERMSEMTYRPLGDSGLMVSAVGIGCNAFGRRVDLDGVRDILDAAQDVGVTLLDTADVYGGQGASEELLGEALQGRGTTTSSSPPSSAGDMQGANGADRGARGSRAYLRRAVEASLRRLRADHLDLYQYHVPDGVTPIEETLSALTDLVREGKVRYLGISNVGGWQVADADWTARTGRLRALRLRAEPLLPSRPHRRGGGRARL